jgi:hypothetical protein
MSLELELDRIRLMQDTLKSMVEEVKELYRIKGSEHEPSLRESILVDARFVRNLANDYIKTYNGGE